MGNHRGHNGYNRHFFRPSWDDGIEGRTVQGSCRRRIFRWVRWSNYFDAWHLQIWLQWIFRCIFVSIIQHAEYNYSQYRNNAHDLSLWGRGTRVRVWRNG